MTEVGRGQANPPLNPTVDARRDERPYFDDTTVPTSTNEYVCWIDVMGSGSIMLRSLNITANFLSKLHIAALRASEAFPVKLYPVIDGVYVCSNSKRDFFNVINRVNTALALTFIIENNPLHRFEIRSGVAYGPVLEGTDLLECAHEFHDHPEHTEQILLGPTLTQAYDIEKKAAPFGVALHESTRCFAPDGEEVMFGTYWRWWTSYCQMGDDIVAAELGKALRNHYSWCQKHTAELSYQKEKIDKHLSLANEYFPE